MPPYADVLKWEHLPFPRSLPSFQKLFPDDAACASYLERVRWEKGFVCPLCDAKGEPYRFTARPGVLRCKACRQDTALTAGTVMERTRTPLTVWFWGAYLVASLTPGLSAMQFQRQLGLKRYATAHEIHRLIALMPIHGVGGWSILRGILAGKPPMTPGPKPKPIAQRFARFVNLNGPVPAHRPELGPCHVWVGAMRPDGYGAMTVSRKAELAHRIAFKIADGRWPVPCALHHCDNRACVRRSHLFEGDKAENTADMVSKDRGTQRTLSVEQVAVVVERKRSGETQAAIARSLGVSESLISLTLRRAKK